ncbi:MAG TPA: tyrosine-protein phosphatase, partial [Micromonosporaceae bacterium]
ISSSSPAAGRAATRLPPVPALWHTPRRMDAPPPSRRYFTRRTLIRLAGAGVLVGLSAEAVRVYALSNKHTVIPGLVYRSAQLDADDLRRVIAAKKIKTVINLRGTCPDTDWYMGEARTTHATGICQEDVSLSAKRLPAPNEVRRLVEVLDRTEYPIIFHCQRGADRTGMVSTIVMLLKTTATLAEARRQLWPRYGHIRGGRTEVIDEFFDYYAAWLTATAQPHTPDRFRQWADRVYCPGPYRADLSLVGPANPEVNAGAGFTLTIRAQNTSAEVWTFRPGGSSGIQLRYQLYTTDGKQVFIGHAGRLVATVRPGEHIDLVAGFPPIAVPGRYVVHADMLDAQPIDALNATFVQYGSEPLLIELTVR